jgi:hypothetical protein
MKRLKLEGKIFGRYLVVKYHYEDGYNYKKLGSFYECIDMVTGETKIIRGDHLPEMKKYFDQLTKEIMAVEEYKKNHNLK